MRSARFLAATLALTSVSAAFSWEDGLQDIKAMADVGKMLLPRQDNSNNQQSSGGPAPSATAPSSQPSNTGAASSGGDSTPTGDRPSGTGDATVTSRPEETGGQRSGNATQTTEEFDPRLPAGGVSMITPAAIAAPFLYKIGDWVTFGWNYTSLSVTPSAIDVLATCSKNQQTYTLAVNQSAGATGRILWDTGAYQATATIPLLTETYTLIIYDAESSISATPRAGYLGVASQFTFAMYATQTYTPRNAWHCASCSGAAALSASERSTLLFLTGMSTITILSFTWFAAGFGVL